MNNVAEVQAAIQSDTPDGFVLFYALVTNRPCPHHAQVWIEAIYKAQAARRLVEIYAFRGSTKTTTVTNLLTAYQLGLYPHKRGVIVQVKDDTAKNNAALVADIIEHNEAFKACFPGVVPDKERGWGDGGYFLKKMDVSYGEWVRATPSKDPSFVGYGYTSDALIGMHPDLFLIMDDLHNEENTRSGRELDHVKRTFSGTLMPLRKPNHPITVLIGTPWTDGDVYAAAAATGEFDVIKTPVQDVDGVPAWPEMMGTTEIEEEKRLDITGGMEFARMYMLDLTASKLRVFKYQTYPAHLISATWPMVGGVDYASSHDPTRRRAQQSHFALAYLAETPERTLVVYDGVLTQCTQAEGETYVVMAQRNFSNWMHTVAEVDGVGREFVEVVRRRNPTIRILETGTRGKSKAARLTSNLGGWLHYGKVRISDADTPFLSALRSFLNRYPNVDEHDPGWDAADSVNYACEARPDVLVIDTPVGKLSPMGRARRVNAFSSLGAQRA